MVMCGVFWALKKLRNYKMVASKCNRVKGHRITYPNDVIKKVSL